MMAQVHNCFIRGLNGIYHLAPKVPTNDLANFVAYCLSLSECIDFHHDEEENVVFPQVEEVTGVKGLMAENVEQHAAFHDGLIAFQDYLRELLASDPTKLSTKRFRQLFRSFAGPLQIHLEAEITCIENLRAYDHTGVDLEKMAAEAAQKSTTPGIIVSQLPALMLNHDRTFEDGYSPGLWPPDIPAPVSFGVRRIGTCWYWGRWKFTTCDANQMPKDLVYMDLPDRIED